MEKNGAPEGTDQLGLVRPEIADGDISLAAAQICGEVLGHEVDAKAGRGATQLVDDRWQEIGDSDLAGGDGNSTLQRLRPPRGTQREPTGRFPHCAHMFEQIEAAGRQFQPRANMHIAVQELVNTAEIALVVLLGHRDHSVQPTGGGPMKAVITNAYGAATTLVFRRSTARPQGTMKWL